MKIETVNKNKQLATAKVKLPRKQDDSERALELYCGYFEEKNKRKIEIYSGVVHTLRHKIKIFIANS